MRAKYKADSLLQIACYNSLTELFSSLIDNSCLIVDTSWRKYLEYPDGDNDILLSRMGDNPPKFTEFPFRDIRLAYHGDFFTINGRKIPETVYGHDNRLPISSLHRFSYKGGKYIVFSGGPREYNGYGGRINYNYFFDVSAAKVVADMYGNYRMISELLLYGELNNDNLLDRVRFDGVLRPSGDPYDTVTITAETYRGSKWRQLMDKNGNPYFIKLLLNGEVTSLKVAETNWMKPIQIM